MDLTHGGSRAAVVANATDVYSPDDRSQAVTRERRDLGELGFLTEELDLRDFFDTDGVEDTMRGYDLIWVRGGDTWTLRYSMARSGADLATRRLLADDAFVYGGYSAGSCVLAPTLKGMRMWTIPPG
jgi:dipeptidase E